MKNSSGGLFLGSSSMFMPNFVWIRLTGSKLLQKYWKSITRFVSYIGAQWGTKIFLTAGGHLGFWEKWKILSQACSKGQVVCPCQILSESDEPDPSYCKKCEFLSSASTPTTPPPTPPPSVTKQFIELPTSQWELKMWIFPPQPPHPQIHPILQKINNSNYKIRTNTYF